MKDMRFKEEIERLREELEAKNILDESKVNRTVTECSLCFCEYLKSECVNCCREVEPHAFCLECFSNQVMHQCEPDFRAHLIGNDSNIVCELCLHHNPPEISIFSLETISRGSGNVVEKFLATRVEIVEIRTFNEQQAKYEAKIGAMRDELARLTNDRQQVVVKHRLHILENILNLRCPRQSCKAVFDDFDGCFAVTCHACLCGFCAW